AAVVDDDVGTREREAVAHGRFVAVGGDRRTLDDRRDVDPVTRDDARDTRVHLRRRHDAEPVGLCPRLPRAARKYERGGEECCGERGGGEFHERPDLSRGSDSGTRVAEPANYTLRLIENDCQTQKACPSATSSRAASARRSIDSASPIDTRMPSPPRTRATIPCLSSTSLTASVFSPVANQMKLA